MITCKKCGLILEENEDCKHRLNIFLNVDNCEYSLKRVRLFSNGTAKEELFPFTIPKHWADWALDNCGASINKPGAYYNLPDILMDWCKHKNRGGEKAASNVEQQIEDILKERR